MEPLRDKFRGALLGTFLGDAVGAPWEGASTARIASIFTSYSTLPPDEQDAARSVFGLLLDDQTCNAYYTDDTQMMLAVAETLVAHPEIVLTPGNLAFGAALAAQFANRFVPLRFYGPGAHCVLTELRAGADWDAPALSSVGMDLLAMVRQCASRQ